MNNVQRKQLIKNLASILALNATGIAAARTEELRAQITAHVEDANQIVVELLEEEQEKYDNMPEGLQSGEKGELQQEVISSLDTAIETFGNVIEKLESPPVAQDDGTEPTKQDWEVWGKDVFETAQQAYEEAVSV